MINYKTQFFLFVTMISICLATYIFIAVNYNENKTYLIASLLTLNVLMMILVSQAKKNYKKIKW